MYKKITKKQIEAEKKIRLANGIRLGNVMKDDILPIIEDLSIKDASDILFFTQSILDEAFLKRTLDYKVKDMDVSEYTTNKEVCNLNELKKILNVLQEEDLSATKAILSKLQETIEHYEKINKKAIKLSTLNIFKDVEGTKK